jgi:PilZ domain
MTLTEREKRLGLQLPVEVQGEDVSGAPFRELTRTLNISGGGVYFECHRAVAVGARLQLAIELPSAVRRHFDGKDVYRARAVVCRIERLEGQETIRLAARFLSEASGEAGGMM